MPCGVSCLRSLNANGRQLCCRTRMVQRRCALPVSRSRCCRYTSPANPIALVPDSPTITDNHPPCPSLLIAPLPQKCAAGAAHGSGPPPSCSSAHASTPCPALPACLLARRVSVPPGGAPCCVRARQQRACQRRAPPAPPEPVLPRCRCRLAHVHPLIRSLMPAEALNALSDSATNCNKH